MTTNVKNGPKYTLVIEGKDYDWNKDTITPADIARLGGWDLAQGVIEIDKDNNELTVDVKEVIDIKPGQSFGKKHRWKRG
ncbi:MAG: hypothetical protein SFV32_07275 [Opitutaceae bacterium]|nr:hypothetical protein [Opitutaceae bacterium]